MKKILLIAWHEYTKHALRKRFVGALLAPLILLLVIVAITFVTMTALSHIETGRVGYIDPANALPAAAMTANLNTDVTFERFTDDTRARQALQNERILAYYALAPDFATSGKADLFYWRREPARTIRAAFEDRVKRAALKDVSPAVATRIISGSDFTFETADGSRKFGENNVASFVLPLGLGVIFLIALLGGSQYLMQAIVDEKENRTMEVVITSVTPVQLMSGKVLGLGFSVDGKTLWSGGADRTLRQWRMP